MLPKWLQIWAIVCESWFKSYNFHLLQFSIQIALSGLLCTVLFQLQCKGNFVTPFLHINDSNKSKLEQHCKANSPTDLMSRREDVIGNRRTQRNTHGHRENKWSATQTTLGPNQEPWRCTTVSPQVYSNLDKPGCCLVCKVSLFAFSLHSTDSI